MPKQNGVIIPHGQAYQKEGVVIPQGQAQQSAGGSYNPTYNVTVNGSNMTADQLMAAIKQWEQRNGTAWRMN